jgi:hypothetical protein
MSHARRRQVARLEQLAKPILERKREGDARIFEFMKSEASIRIACLSLIILYGEPRIDEPLTIAWDRCAQSAAWRSCLERHPDFGGYGRFEERMSPFFSLGASYIAKYFRKYFLPELPGVDEKEKFDNIFVVAPPWFIWFTFVDVYAALFGIKLPDLSGVNRYVRNTSSVCGNLPKGPFECRLMPDGVFDIFHVPKTDTLEDKMRDMTPRERKRFLRQNAG